MSVQRGVIFKAIAPMSNERRLKYLVDKFFTDIKPESKELSMVKRALRQEFLRFHCRQGKWRIEYSENRHRIIYKFKEKPTEDYLRRLQEKSKAVHVQECLNRLKEHAANIKAGAPPVLPLVGVLQAEPKCKHCGGNEWVMNQRFACAKCGIEGRAIHPAGFDHRNMRREDGHDPSQNNGFVRDHNLSDAANRATMVCRAPASARGSGDPVGAKALQGLQRGNGRLNPRSKTDNQIIRAEKKMQEACCKMELAPVFAKRAYRMFVDFTRNNDTVPREEETIAACIFNVMPPLQRISATSVSSASSASASSASSAGASSVGASGASRKRPRCETPEYLLLKEMTEQFRAEETEKKKRRNSL